MAAIMNEALELAPGMKVLEVGAGSGYHAATVAEQVGPEGHVYTVELVPDLAEFARKNLERAGYTNRVTIVHGDGSLGYKEQAPYDRVLVTAAAPKIPQALVEQLKSGGLLVIPVGARSFPQELIRARKLLDGHVQCESLGGVAFVPLIGKEGFTS